jgi:hypothetical protein
MGEYIFFKFLIRGFVVVVVVGVGVVGSALVIVKLKKKGSP